MDTMEKLVDKKDWRGEDSFSSFFGGSVQNLKTLEGGGWTESGDSGRRRIIQWGIRGDGEGMGG